MAAAEETFPTTYHPSFNIDPSVAGDNRVALELVETAASSHPDVLEKAVDLYTQGPDIVSGVLDFLRENPDSQQTLEALVHVMDRKLDLEIEYDSLTEAAIETDPYYASIIRDFQRTRDEKARDQYRSQMRSRRWKLFIHRSRNAA